MLWNFVTLFCARCAVIYARTEQQFIMSARTTMLFLLWIASVFHVTAHNSEVLSTSKGGGLRIGSCDISKDIFSGPYEEWIGCDDATEYTWKNDFDNDLWALSMENRLKLQKSVGFCPHRRCQLEDAGGSDESGLCPAGLCFTKLERGRLSYGACCYRDGHFNSGQLIGYYNKSQVSPKPIYKKNRIVLGYAASQQSRDSYDHFMNANEIYPGIIATQCPLTSYPAGYANTVSDMKIDGDYLHQYDMSKYCEVLPLTRFNNASHPDSVGVSNLSHIHNSEEHYYSTNFTLEGHLNSKGVWEASNSEKRRQDAHGALRLHSNSNTSVNSLQVKHIWFYQWQDFGVPNDQGEETLLRMATLAAEELRQNRKIVISCYSGRGRTGTFSAIVAALTKNVKTHSQLVDIIVSMRESRDGILETPHQMQYVLRSLGLNKRE